jgi:hypothetical protein
MEPRYRSYPLPPMTRRAPDIDIIEGPGVLIERTVRLRLGKAPRRVELLPHRREFMFTDQDGDAMTAVDRFMGHQAIRFQL